MYSLAISDHVMVAHAPAGATYVIDVEFRAPRLDDANGLVDPALARAELRRVLDSIDRVNLDTLPALAGQVTTPAFLAHQLFQALARACVDGALGEGGQSVTTIRVRLRESPVVWTAYEGSLV